MDINFEEYKIFYYVAINGSISKAAEALYISQPAITKSIKKLENKLGIILFNRTPKGSSLTENGKVLFEFVKNGVESFSNAEHRLTSLKNLDEGIIRIGASTTVTKYFLLPFIEKFHKLHPNIQISITNHLTKDLISMLKKGSLDVLVLNLPMKLDNNLKVVQCLKLHDLFARK
ncbi:MAG: LysR family transcriptional regulator [Clostridia bacterium]|nr:LysR family transcriptional regulator [Clostridia bacterium]